MYFVFNIILAIVWVGLTGDLSFGNIIFALLLSALLVGLSQRGALDLSPPKRENKGYVTRLLLISYFVVYFLKELVLASVSVLVSILLPLSRLKPGVIAVPLDLETEAEITLLANLITLTPGTLTLDVSSDKKVIYVHAILVEDPEVFRKSIKNGFEKRVMEILR